ncbi:MAG TPA: bile acid:sodium symporter [Acidimicrobiales bacterium]
MTAQHLFTVLFNAGIAISIGATVASLGMSFTVRQLVAPLRRVVLVVAIIVLNALVIPAAAWGIARATPMANQYVAGLVLATIGMGSAGALKGAQLAKRADLPLAVSLVVVLQVADIVAVPLWAGHVVSGASISAWDIVKDLLLLVLAPLAVGLLLKARYPDNASGWQPDLVKASNLALVVALATGIAANWHTIVTMFGSWVILTAIIITVLSLGLGALLGGRSPETRATTTLVSGMRFASLGLIIIGTQLGGSANYIGPAITFALVSLILPMLLAVEIGRTATTEPGLEPVDGPGPA